MPRGVPKKPKSKIIETPEVKASVSVETLPEPVKAQLKKLNASEELVRALITEMFPAMVAASAAANPTPVQAQAAVRKRQRCQDCGQDKLSGCKGEHVMMVVYPTKDPAQNGKWWPGCKVNGVRYLSNDTSHQVLVPANCEGDFKYQIALYEKNETELARGRAKHHNSGNVESPNLPTHAFR